MPTARCAPPPAASGTPTAAGDRAGMPRTGQGARIAEYERLLARRVHRAVERRSSIPAHGSCGMTGRL